MILDLNNKEASQIKWEVSSFPDGQQSIVLDVSNLKFENTEIKSRLNNFKQLEIIIAAVKALNNVGIPDKAIDLTSYYLVGARSDRKFQEGGIHYLRDVLTPILRSLDLGTIKVMDIHSDVCEALLPNLFSMTNKSLVQFAINDIYGLTAVSEDKDIQEAYDKFCILSPDSGAMKKVYKLANSLNYKGQIVCCSKDRDENGKLSKVIVPDNLEIDNEILLIDDIGDGFGTFINIAKILPKDCNLYLIITHSIQQKGLENALNYFKKIYTTNSFADYNIENVKQLDIWK